MDLHPVAPEQRPSDQIFDDRLDRRSAFSAKSFNVPLSPLH
jgi:hypothetical protein